MKRRSNSLETGEPSEVWRQSRKAKRPKIVEDSSDTDSSTSKSSRSKRSISRSEQSTPKRSYPRRSKALEAESEPSPRHSARSGVKRGSAAKKAASQNKGGSGIPRRRGSSAVDSSGESDEDSVVGLVNPPKYVDFVLLPGTTLTIHRKEFIMAELKYTSKTMATKLANKVSRAVKRGEYTHRANLAPGAPLQRPLHLCPPPTQLTLPLHPIAVDLRTNRKEPPRPQPCKF